MSTPEIPTVISPPPEWKDLEEWAARNGLEVTLRMSFRPDRSQPGISSRVSTKQAPATPVTPITPVKPNSPAYTPTLRPSTKVDETVDLRGSRGSSCSSASSVSAIPQSSQELPTVPAYPGFEAFELLGEGGMGRVFRAEQHALQRDVALKILKESDPRLKELLVSEARILGCLEHGNIPPVHALGMTPDGSPFLALKLIKGTSWRDLIKSGSPLKEHLRILLASCQALAFAHARGIVHRDIKPDNVMTGEFGQVFVVDWGLAACSDETAERQAGLPRLSSCGHPAGTPGYMAPELALGQGPKQGPTTDVFLLGACLYEALCGHPPNQGRTMLEVLDNAARAKSRVFPKDVPPELVALCGKALAHDPAHRFASVEELARAIERYQEYEQAIVLARKGEALTAKLEPIALDLEKARDTERDRLDAELHRGYGEARFAFQHALTIAPEMAEPRTGLLKLDRLMLRSAEQTDNLAFARQLAQDQTGESLAEFTEAVERMEKKAKARAAEWLLLRQTAERFDAMAGLRPLGPIMVIIGSLGLMATIATGFSRWLGILSHNLVTPAIFIVICGIGGAISYRKVRDANLLKNQIAVQTILTWGALGLACVMLQVLGLIKGLSPNDLLPFLSLFISVGVAYLAFSLHFGLLLPALGFLVASPLMARFSGFNREILGSLTFCTVIGVGLFLRYHTPTPGSQEQK